MVQRLSAPDDGRFVCDSFHCTNIRNAVKVSYGIKTEQKQKKQNLHRRFESRCGTEWDHDLIETQKMSQSEVVSFFFFETTTMGFCRRHLPIAVLK